jgi:hypothetical protein
VAGSYEHGEISFQIPEELSAIQGLCLKNYRKKGNAVPVRLVWL